MKLTIGMAAFDDYDGVVFTCQHLALYHSLRDWEIVVVDNNPGSNHGRETESFCRGVGGRKDGLIRYIPMPEAQGTSQPRNRVFSEARGDIVVCMDSHVLLAPGSMDNLLAWCSSNPNSMDLIQGPLLYDPLGYCDCAQPSTHFDETFRSQMEGTWQTDPRGLDPAGAPFDIPSQGLGFFACRKAAWLGFNEHFRAFGGEECYIHRKFRKAGHRTLCHPGIRWWHRFGRPGGVKYRLDLYAKVRNYVLGRIELDMPLDPVYNHFVGLDHPGESLPHHLMREHGVNPRQIEGKTEEQLRAVHAAQKLPRRLWDYLLEDPIAHETEPQAKKKEGCGGCGGSLQPTDGAHLDQIFEWACATPRDLDKHLPKLRDLSAKVEHVTEFSKRRESTVGLLAGYPTTFVSYNLEKDPLHQTLAETVKRQGGMRSTRVGETGGRQIKTFTQTIGPDAHALTYPTIDETDLLFIDSVHSADRLWAELDRHGGRVRRFIVLRGTGQFGEKAEGSDQPGLLYAARRWMKEYPAWSVVYHTVEEYGLTVLSCDDQDKPKLPSVLTMAANFSKAMAEHVADGLKKVSSDQLEARLAICSMCDQRRGDRCAACGCFLAAKAAMRSNDCPLSRWPALQQEEPA